MNFTAVSRTLVQLAAGLMLLASSGNAARAGEALIAVAANFTHAAARLVEEFEARSGHEITMTTGSTGRLFSQISYGAPFDVFLSADRKHPRLLEEAGRIVPGSRFTYAVGRLVLLAKPGHSVETVDASMLADASVRRVAIANPALAPYGEAALETIESAGLTDIVGPKLIFADSVGQVYAFVQTSNVEFGFVALSQVFNRNDEELGARWIVPPDFHVPIEQDAILTRRSSGNQAAFEFHEFLKGAVARDIVLSFGYDFPAGDV